MTLAPRLTVLATIAIVLGCATAYADEGPFKEPSVVAKPLTIVEPEFPNVGSTEPVKVRIDVNGVVATDGTFEWTDAPPPGANAPYVASIKDALRWWRFVPATDNETCSPVPQPSALTVWFEGTAADPHIFLSLPAKAKSEETHSPRIDKFTDASIKFPEKIGAEGYVEILLAFDADGRVSAANILASTPYGLFDRFVRKHAMQTTVTWKEGMAPIDGKRVCVVRPYTFCIDTWASAIGLVSTRCAH